MTSDGGESSSTTRSHDEGAPLLPVTTTSLRIDDDDDEHPTPSAPSSSAVVHGGRLLLLLVSFLYGSLSVSLRMVYARPGPPAASILSATRGWMTVGCLLPVVILSSCRSKDLPPPDPPRYSRASFYWFALELAVFNFGTQGLLNVGLLTTESARSAFFTQLSVVITPVLAATIGCFRKTDANAVRSRVWFACFLALLGLYVLSSTSGGESESDTNEDAQAGGDAASPAVSSGLTLSRILHFLSFGDWCCFGSAFCWSYYIYRLSDWGDRYDEAKTMFAKNVFMAILYTLWTVLSYAWTTVFAGVAPDDTTGFFLWEGWRDPVALSILFYTALSSGAVSDILQQKAQAHVPAAESNVLLSLEPVFAALLGLGLLAEVPSARECLGGACIVIASVLASSGSSP